MQKLVGAIIALANAVERLAREIRAIREWLEQMMESDN